MRFLGLTQRNFKEILRDRQYLIVLLAMPAVLIVFMNQLFRGLGGPSGPEGNGAPDFMSLERITMGMTVFALLWLMTLASGKIVGDKETGYLRRLRTTPTRAVEFVLAYSISPILISVFQILFVFGVALLLGLKWQENTYLVLIVLFLCGLSSISLGMILSSFTSNREQVEGITLLILFPLSFLSGAFIPVEILPSWASAIGSATYTGQAITAGVSVLVDNAGLEAIVQELRNLGIWAGSLFLLGVLCFRRNI